MTRKLHRLRLFGVLLLVGGAAAALPLSGQDADRYPGPFPGGYPSMSGIGGSGKMYMESYFPPPVTASPTYPAFSPDGESIAFAYQGRIWAVSAEGGVARQLTSGAGYHSMPSWSSDGRHIAYAADVDLNLDIFLLDLETGESRRLTEDPAIDMRPRFSPDGSRILFTTGRDGTFDLWAYDLDAGALESVIAHPGANDMAGDWIGDTGDIVFVSKRGEAALGSGSLWRWSADTGEAELLIRIETNYQASPVVAPHGGSVAYVTDASGNNDIYQVPTYRAGAAQDRSSP
ncbi:MAG: PD40 domain-containing protein, partial [Acidimicrobiia bacterium]|nr:PD40 domain-containing protein [Acidimicrobiia bacterium]